MWIDAAIGVAISRRRLAIIDLSEAGAQPMTSADGHLLPELWYLQPNFPSLGVQPTFVVASLGIPAGLAALIALGIA